MLSAALSLASVPAFAAAPYLRAPTPISDSQGRVQVIIDFADDAYLRYPGSLPSLPNSSVAPSNIPFVPKAFFHNEKTLALIADFERVYGFTRTGMTSWAGHSVTAFMDADTVKRVLDNSSVKQISENERSAFSTAMPSGGWGNTTAGPETISWGTNAVNGKVFSGTTQRKIYIIGSGVADHDDLPTMTRLNVACGSSGNCNATDSYTYPLVGCYAHATHVAGIIGAKASNDKTSRGVYAGFPNIVSLNVSKRTEGNTSNNCSDSLPSSDTIGYALDYIEFDATQNNPNKVVHIATMSINPGGVATDLYGNNGPNRYRLQTITASLSYAGYIYHSGVFFVQAAGNYPNDVQWAGTDDSLAYSLAYRPDSGVSALTGDGIMVVGASHHNGGAVTTRRRFSSFATGFPSPDPSTSSTFPYAQTGIVDHSRSDPFVDIYAPGNLIVSTWGIHIDRSVPSIWTLVGPQYFGSVATPVTYGTHSSVPAATQGWAFLSGSSMAAPHVAAAAAWLADQSNPATPGQLEQLVRANVNSDTDDASIPAVPVVRLP